MLSMLALRRRRVQFPTIPPTFRDRRTAERRQVSEMHDSAWFTSKSGEGDRTLDIQLGKLRA
jgi:hypothetical protein